MKKSSLVRPYSHENIVCQNVSCEKGQKDVFIILKTSIYRIAVYFQRTYLHFLKLSSLQNSSQCRKCLTKWMWQPVLKILTYIDDTFDPRQEPKDVDVNTEETWAQFHQHFTSSFYECRSQK